MVSEEEEVHMNVIETRTSEEASLGEEKKIQS
jgi:hypothetical protein